MDEREELRACLESLTEAQWSWFISAAQPVLQELVEHELRHQEDRE